MTVDVRDQHGARRRPWWRRWLRRLAIAVAALAVLVTIASLLYNWATDGREKPAAALYPGPFVRVDATTVAYRRWGNTGSPIVLLGGFAEPSWVWHEVGPLLGRNHRVVAIDLPPFGYTQRVGDPSLTEWMDLVEAVTRRLGLRHPLVVGHSLGAAVATGIALEHPAEVSGIVLLDGDALRSGGGGGFVSALLIDPYVTSIYRLLTGSDFVFRQVLERALGPDRPPISSTMLSEFERPFQVQGTEQQLRDMLPHGIIGLDAADLPHVHVPATVVWGQYDSVDSPSAGRRTAAALHAPFELISGAGHLSMLVRPAAVARAIDRAAAKR
jgi:pimeloyl-ACP methyl ester carboxylesterase